MKKYRLILILLMLCVLTEAVLLYRQTIQNPKSNRIFLSESMSAMRLLDNALLQSTCDSIEKAITEHMGVMYRFENMKYYFDLEYPDMNTECDTSNGIWVRVEVSSDKTGITNSKNDPYLLGYHEGIEQQTDPERIALLEDIALDNGYYRDDNYQRTEITYYTVYVWYDTSELGMFKSNEITEYTLLCLPDSGNSIEDLIPFEQKYPHMTYEDWKEKGRQTALE